MRSPHLKRAASPPAPAAGRARRCEFPQQANAPIVVLYAEENWPRQNLWMKLVLPAWSQHRHEGTPALVRHAPRSPASTVLAARNRLRLRTSGDVAHDEHLGDDDAARLRDARARRSAQRTASSLTIVKEAAAGVVADFIRILWMRVQVQDSSVWGRENGGRHPVSAKDRRHQAVRHRAFSHEYAL
jgi:hypothetical protein